MPMKKGTSKATTKQNFEEFGKGKTYAHTKKKFGKKKADKQRIAAVLNNKRRSAKRR
jgi:hypothetical protein